MGNTLIINNNNDNETFYCKRGLQKFFELSPEIFIFDNEGNFNKNISFLNKKKRNAIFWDFDRKYGEEKENIFHIYKLKKLIGEQCQISFINKLNCWVIGTKVYCVLLRNKEDLLYYQNNNNTSYPCVLIGKKWFEIIEKLDNEVVCNLKKETKGFTLIGEFCGFFQNNYKIY